MAKQSKAVQRRQQERGAARRRQIAGSLEEWRPSAFANALEQFDTAARRLHLTENQIAMIKLPRRITVDLHWPGQFRAIGPHVNLPEFYEAFGIKEGAPMWKAPELRAKIW